LFQSNWNIDHLLYCRFLRESKFLYHPKPAEPSIPYQTDESKPQINVIFRLNKLIETSETQNMTNKVERLFSFIRINSASFPNSQPNTNIACCAVDFVHS
jgi:hypothetical protein